LGGGKACIKDYNFCSKKLSWRSFSCNALKFCTHVVKILPFLIALQQVLNLV
jgi:hypothetical protein